MQRDSEGAKGCKSDRSRQEVSNAYLVETFAFVIVDNFCLLKFADGLGIDE